MFTSKSKTLLLVNEGDARGLKQIVEDSNYLSRTIDQICTVKEFHEGNNKNTLKKSLNEFDLILVDQRLSLMKVAKELGGGM